MGLGRPRGAQFSPATESALRDFYLAESPSQGLWSRMGLGRPRGAQFSPVVRGTSHPHFSLPAVRMPAPGRRVSWHPIRAAIWTFIEETAVPLGSHLLSLSPGLNR